MQKIPKIVCLDCDAFGSDTDWSEIAALGEMVTCPNACPHDVPGLIADADIVLTNSVAIGAAAMDAAPRLKMIGALATGYDVIDVAAAKARGITVCNVRDYSTEPVAQHVFALMLELAGGLCQNIRAVQAGEWPDPPLRRVVELGGKTLGIVGYGSIGSQVAKIGHGFGMSILAYAPHEKPLPDYRPFAYAGLDELLAKSDFVSLNCPHTVENHRMINKTTLSKMKRGAYLINCARGGLVNEADLRAALESGQLAGAGLDVAEHEPIPRSSPLLGAPNCVITPHMAWASLEARARLLAFAASNIRNFLAGKPTNVVS